MESIGTILREKRERSGLTLDDVAAATKIGKTYLAAIEEDNFSSLPPGPFARGFVIAYFKHLKLDPEPFLHLIEKREETSPPDRPKKGEELQRRISHPAPVPEQTEKEREGWDRRIFHPWLTVLLALLFAAGSGLLLFLHLPERGKKTETKVEKEGITPAPPKPAGTGEALAPPRAGGSLSGETLFWDAPFPGDTGGENEKEESEGLTPAEPTLPSPEAEKSILILASEKSHLLVWSGGRKLHDGVLHEGERFQFEEKPRTTVILENSGGVNIFYKGRPFLCPAGSRGERKVFLFPPVPK